MLYFSARPTRAVALVTMGRNFCASGALVVLRKYSVAAVSPPGEGAFFEVVLPYAEGEEVTRTPR